MENLFALISILPLPFWGAMLLFPRAGLTRRMVTSPWPFIVLGAVHALLLVAALATAAPAELGLSAVAIRSALGQRWGFLALWSHILILDLFAGIWIFRDAGYWRVRPAPYLLATLFAGPLGLALYLYLRQRHERHDPVRNLN
ncbi:MAG TPA: ABA4-like family protein [Trueperaceae bacterium]